MEWNKKAAIWLNSCFFGSVALYYLSEALQLFGASAYFLLLMLALILCAVSLVLSIIETVSNLLAFFVEKKVTLLIWKLLSSVPLLIAVIYLAFNSNL